MGSSYSILRWAHGALSSLVKAAVSDASLDVLGHTSCFAADSTDKSLGLYDMDAVYLQSGSLICCDMEKVQWP